MTQIPLLKLHPKSVLQRNRVAVQCESVKYPASVPSEDCPHTDRVVTDNSAPILETTDVN